MIRDESPSRMTGPVVCSDQAARAGTTSNALASDPRELGKAPGTPADAADGRTDVPPLPAPARAFTVDARRGEARCVGCGSTRLGDGATLAAWQTGHVCPPRAPRRSIGDALAGFADAERRAWRFGQHAVGDALDARSEDKP